MIYLVFERATGMVLTHIIADEPPEVLDHHDTIETATIPADYRLVKIVADAIEIEAPSAAYMAARKSKIAAKIDAARDARLNAGVSSPLGTIQADDRSRINIAGAVSLAQLAPATFSLAWRLADNTTILLNAAQMIQVGQLVGSFTSTTYSQSSAFKDALMAITDLDVLNEFTFTFD